MLGSPYLGNEGGDGANTYIKTETKGDDALAAVPYSRIGDEWHYATGWVETPRPRVSEHSHPSGSLDDGSAEHGFSWTCRAISRAEYLSARKAVKVPTADALARQAAVRLAELEAVFLSMPDPGNNAAAAHQLGVIAALLKRHDEALSRFDQAIARAPEWAAAHYNRAVALVNLGRSRESIASFERATVLDPGTYDAHRALGFLWLAEGQRGRALDHLARTYELRRGEDRSRMALASLTSANKAKLTHDAAQFRYLSTRRRDRARFELLARLYDDVAATCTDETARLSTGQLDQLGEDYNTAISVAGAPEQAGPAVSPTLDADAITRRIRDDGGAAWFDGLLTPPALAGLRTYLLESTIWHDFGHIGGFVASYLEDGLACPLLLRIADEVRQRFPTLLAAHPMSQAWAFKGLAGESAVDAHADDAVFSLNFWVTPDAANLTSGSGGLGVCRVPPPADWEIAGYNANAAAIAAFLDAHRAETMIVPYAENRAVLFRSRLFHRSDAPRFAAGYTNHRINVTLLFGRHGA